MHGSQLSLCHKEPARNKKEAPEQNCQQQSCNLTNVSDETRLPDFIPHSGLVSMDNPEYILQETKRRATNSGNYHTLGIPVTFPSPSSSSGPASLPAPPYTSLSSTAGSGLNGAVGRTSDGENSEHDYYNDVPRECQPLQQGRNETTV